ncbi:MAG: hypothetical protein M1312_02570 [Patescibacteria group bacterium]|nr:hypothetical protein [Patescibacteria group bacterium]
MQKRKLFITGGVIVLALAVSIGISKGALAAGNNPAPQHGDQGWGAAIASGFETSFSHAFNQIIGSGILERYVPSTLSISPSGHIRITGGSVTAASSSSITASVWGLSFNVVPGNSVLEGPDQQAISASDIQVGDKVSVSGMLNPSTEMISADTIVDYSFVIQQGPSPLQVKLSALLQLLQQLQVQLMQMQTEITSTVSSSTSAPTSTATSTSSSTPTSTSTTTSTSTPTSTPTSTSTSTSTSTPTSTSTSSSTSTSTSNTSSTTSVSSTPTSTYATSTTSTTY